MINDNECNEQPSLRAAWTLDPDVTMLNHGSFGACARVVQQRQQELRRQMELEPVRFFVREMQPLLDESRGALARLIGADESDVVFVRNATNGVNSVLRSLRFRPGDELLDRFGIEVPVFHWPAPPEKLLRISAQAYNTPTQYERLAAALRELL